MATLQQPDAHLPTFRRNRFVWGVIAVLVIAAFFFVWTLGNYGTPGRSEVAPAAPVGAQEPGQIGTLPNSSP